MTADAFIDDPRQPTLMPTGVLDSTGDMIMRVAIPIREQVGFAIPARNNPSHPDMVEYLAPAESLTLVEEHMGGVNWVTEAEALDIDPNLLDVEEEDDGTLPTEIGGMPVVGFSDTGMPVVKLSDLLRKLTAEGVAVAIDLEFNEEPGA